MLSNNKRKPFLRFPFFLLAEGEGFKPPIPIRVYRISSPARSITLPTFLFEKWNPINDEIPTVFFEVPGGFEPP